MKRIVFLVSGSGGTLKFLYYAIEILKIDFQIVGVLADRECDSLKFAEFKNIYAKKIIYKSDNAVELRAQLSYLSPDIIITNIHKIIDEETLRLSTGKFINVHYSLLPSFAGMIGMETVIKAREQNVHFIGGTCHEVTKDVDSGKILQQGCFSVNWNDDNSIIDSVFKTTCYCLLGGIYKDEKIKNDVVLINNYRVCFSPPLSFTDNKFSDEFWNLIRSN